jgi:hypothetical protein
MKRIALGLDYITIKFSNTTFSPEKALLKLNHIFRYDLSQMTHYQKEKWDYYFNKNYGTYFKIKKDKIEIEFHSTFFALFDLSTVQAIRTDIHESFSSYPRIISLDVAQDFINLPVEKFLPKDAEKRLAFTFNIVEHNYGKNLKNGKVGTYYYKDRHRSPRWQIKVYDKTDELLKNLSKASPVKQAHYRQAGYLDNEVTRVELTFRSEMLKELIDVVDNEICEETLCKKLLQRFYNTHKIYSLKKGQKFDKKHPERHNEWRKWATIFKNSRYSISPKEIRRDMKFKEMHNTDLDEVVKKLTTYSFRYNFSPEELFEKLREQKKEVVKASNLHLESLRITQEELSKRLKEAA